ncbi:MAG: aminotransferase class III-fold pyridoxal phosphate-dependent enzyme, partial [Oceanisphaera sp.]|nr:aminotransferase class III-fold pyridoxal phosphate-dependent enzyme [Oceanisphaera sp.]
RKLVIKIANSLEEAAQLEAENQVMGLIARRTGMAPELVPTSAGDLTAIIPGANGAEHLVRLVTYLEGLPMGMVKRHSTELLYRLGVGLGQMTKALAGFDHPAAHREFHWDLAQAPKVINQWLPLVKETGLADLIGQIRDHFEAEVETLLPRIRQSVIHNDANDYNIIVGGNRSVQEHNQELLGFVDFGDLVHSHTVNELAIAIAYAVLNKPNPLAAAVNLVRGFHEVCPLAEDELSALFGLVRMRLAASVCIAAFQQSQRPDVDYLGISQAPIRKTLPMLAQIPPPIALTAFRRACRLEPNPAGAELCEWLKQNQAGFGPVLQGGFSGNDYTVLDLGIGTHLLSGDPNAISEPQVSAAIDSEMAAAGAKVGVGMFREPRLIYTASAFRAEDPSTQEGRTVHLGLDLFAPEGTGVTAPLDGVVHLLATAASPLDYGHVIILAHEAVRGQIFYTLYGHLSAASLEGMQSGQKISKGQRFASLGGPQENGGWTPHLHFQIMTDLLGLGLDFPGVGRFSEVPLWASYSPDPNLILNLEQGRKKPLFPAPKRNLSKTLVVRRQKLGYNLSIGYRQKLRIERGWRQFLWDDTGRRYLDAYNNVPHVGHCHPKVVEAGCRQMAVLSTNTRYLHDALNEYAELLSGTMPESLQVCYFVNSGSEANELAVRLARAYTSAKDMIVLEGAYHGNTNTNIDISPYKYGGPGGMGAPDWVHTGPSPDVYRGAYKADDPQAAAKYAQAIASLIEGVTAMGRKLCGFIAETCPSVGGQIIPPPGYLAMVYDHVRAAGGVCIADEVQTGYGRLGTHFYAFEHQEAIPDIVVLGKPIGNGHPIAAVVTTPEIAAAFDNGMEFFSTFGGSTVSAVVGKTVLEVTLEENLQANALRV